MKTSITFLKSTTIALIIFACFGKQLQAQHSSGLWGSKQLGIQLNMARWHDVFFESYPILDQIGIQAQLRWELNPRLDLVCGIGVDQGYIQKTNLFVEEIPGPTPGTTVSIVDYDQRKAKAFNFDLPVLFDYELLLKENWSLSLQAGFIFIHQKVNSESIIIDAEFFEAFSSEQTPFFEEIITPDGRIGLTIKHKKSSRIMHDWGLYYQAHVLSSLFDPIDKPYFRINHIAFGYTFYPKWKRSYGI